MDDIEYKKMIHNTVVPETLSNEEKDKKYAPLLNFLKMKLRHSYIVFVNVMKTVFLRLIKISFGVLLV